MSAPSGRVAHNPCIAPLANLHFYTVVGARFLWRSEGRNTETKAQVTPWVELAETAEKGADSIKVFAPQGLVGWLPGAKIVLAASDRADLECSTDRRDLCQTEEVAVKSVSAGKDGIATVAERRLRGPLD